MSCLQVESGRQRGSSAVQGGLALGRQARAQARDHARAVAAQHLQLLQHLHTQPAGLNGGAGLELTPQCTSVQVRKTALQSSSAWDQAAQRLCLAR